MLKLMRKLSLTVWMFTLSFGGVWAGQTLTLHLLAATSAHAKPSLGEAKSGAGTQDRYENLELFQKVLHYVENNYVDEVKNKDLIYGAIKGMLETLDPHSQFMTPEVFKEMKTDTQGKFGGLGIEIGMKDNILTVIAPIEDTPAWRGGLKPNDRIVKINGESTKGMSLMEAVNKMRGKKGTDVTLAIYRDGFERIKDVKITRDIIKIQSVKYEVLDSHIGYMRLTTFNESAGSDLRKALDTMNKKDKLRGLVFDLRTNPGGLLDQAVEVTSLFVDKGVVVSTIPRNKDEAKVLHAIEGRANKDIPLVVLVNSSSASAAEIVAGALQDHHRGIIMGQPTFGKGSVQTLIELGADVGLKLTIARYYTPSGRSIQEKGVQPDIILDEYDPKLLAQAKLKGESFRERDLKGHMVNTDKEAAEAAAEEKKKDDFKREELEALAAKKAKGGKGADKDDDDMTPVKISPKDDYQVREAVNYLKSFDIIKKLASGTPAQAPTEAKN